MESTTKLIFSCVMTILKRRGNKNNPRLYNGTFYQSAGHPTEPMRCISIKDYCNKYFVTRDMVKTMLKNKELCGVTYKKKLFVTDIAPTRIRCFD